MIIHGASKSDVEPIARPHRNMQTGEMIDQIGTLLKEVDRAQRCAQYEDLSGGLPKDELRQIYTRLRAAIDRLSPPGSPYAKEADVIAAQAGSVGNAIMNLGGVLQAIRADFEAGYVRTFEALVHSAVFEDFLDMASELLTKAYKDSAAVIAGSVLEEHVRSLATRHGRNLTDGKLPRSVDTLLIELVKDGQFSESQRKLAVGWYGLRTDAAHGRYENVVAGEVGRMIEGIREFMLRYPA